MQPADELDDHAVQVVRDEVEEAPGGEERERALQGFEERDNPQPLFEALFQAAQR